VSEHGWWKRRPSSTMEELLGRAAGGALGLESIAAPKVIEQRLPTEMPTAVAAHPVCKPCPCADAP